MENKWIKFDENPSSRYTDTVAAWNLLINRLDDDGLIGQQDDERQKHRGRTLYRWAAAILVLLAVGIPTVYYGVFKTHFSASQITYQSEKGISTLDLPDESRIFLNKGSRITYPKRFENNRSVTLDGEAFFEVMSDPENPFTVRSGKVTVSVFGTSFNVRSIKSSGNVEVFVEAGTVRMSMDNSTEVMMLEKGEVGVSDNSVLTKSIQRDPNYISWKTKDFKFVNKNLAEVLAVLSKAYHVKIDTGDVLVNTLRLTSTYKEQSIESILETIGTAFGITVEKKGDGFYLRN